MYHNENQPTLPFAESEKKSTPREADIRSEPNTNYQIRNSQKGMSKKQKMIEKIVIFYSDHSLDEYYPNEE